MYELVEGIMLKGVEGCFKIYKRQQRSKQKEVGIIVEFVIHPHLKKLSAGKHSYRF